MLIASLAFLTYGLRTKSGLLFTIYGPTGWKDRDRDTRELQELWAKVANETLEHTGDDARAIREANSVVARQEEK